MLGGRVRRATIPKDMPESAGGRASGHPLPQGCGHVSQSHVPTPFTAWKQGALDHGARPADRITTAP